MTTKQMVFLVLKQVETKFKVFLPPYVTPVTARKCAKMRQGILLLADGILSTFFKYGECSLLWESGVAQRFEEWAAQRMVDENTPPPGEENMYVMLIDHQVHQVEKEGGGPGAFGYFSLRD